MAAPTVDMAVSGYMSSRTTPALEESTSVIIRRAPSDVWEFVADLATTPTWRTTVSSIEPPDRLEVGERFSGTTRLLGRTWQWVLEVSHVDVGTALGYVVVEGIVKPHVGYRLEPVDDGTRFTMTGGIDQFGFAGRLLKPFALPALRRETAAHLSNLKDLLESR
jgi:hypothetical protein